MVWTEVEASASAVVLQYVSADGDQGFPGALTATLRYELTDRNELVMEYTATASADTPCSLTNHSYWCLGGQSAAAAGGRGIRDHTLQLEADRWLVTGTEGEPGSNGNKVKAFDPSHGVSSDGIPTGELRDVAGSPHDFRAAPELGGSIDAIATQYPEWPHGDGYVCRSQDTAVCALVGELYHPSSGRVMTVSSTEPVAQLYFSTFLEGTVGKAGTRYGNHGGFCIEMERYADCVTVDTAGLDPTKAAYVEMARPFTLLKAGETYRQRTVHAFTAR